MSRKDRIDDIKNELKALSGGDMTSWTSPDLPEHVAEQFWKDVLAFETAPTTTNFQQLTRAGVPLPPPDDVADPDMHSVLWGVINGLAAVRVFLQWTDHLSDRQLYEALWKDVLHDEIADLPATSPGAWHVDMSGGDPESGAYWKYYADEEHRKAFLEQEPGFDMPPHQQPPYDRDRHLPAPPDQTDGDTRH